MKKVLLVALIITLLTGCSNKKFYLDDENYFKNEVIDIDANKLNSFIDDDKSFVVFAYTTGCISCIQTEKILKEFQEKYNILFYSIEASQMHETYLDKYIKYTPSIAIYNKGKLISYLDAEAKNDKKYYESVDGLYEWFSKYVSLK